MFDLFVLDFVRSALLVTIITGVLLAYLGTHVVGRGIVFVDLALGQISMLGVAVTVYLELDPTTISMIFTLVGAFLMSFIKVTEKRLKQDSISRISRLRLSFDRYVPASIFSPSDWRSAISVSSYKFRYERMPPSVILKSDNTLRALAKHRTDQCYGALFLVLVMVVAWNYGVEPSSSPSDLFGDDSELIDVEIYISEIPATPNAHYLVEDYELGATANGLVDRKSKKNKTDDLPEIIRAPASKRRHIPASAFRHDTTLKSWAIASEQRPTPDIRPALFVFHLSTVVLLT